MNLEWAAAGAKLCFYAAGGLAAGTALAALSLRSPAARVSSQIRRGAAVAIVAAGSSALLLLLRLGVGLEWELAREVMDGPAGVTVALQLVGGLMLLTCAGASLWSGLGALVLLSSFGASGHASSHGLPQALVTVAHVAVAAWWAGGLTLVRAACARHPAEAAATARRFSRLALFFVAGLAATGAFLVWELVTIAGFQTSYARTLLGKLLVVAAALAVAARSRRRHLPALVAGDPRPLHRSVTIELALLAAALSVTAWLTTFESPHTFD
jgi:putative copper export protein